MKKRQIKKTELKHLSAVCVCEWWTCLLKCVSVQKSVHDEIKNALSGRLKDSQATNLINHYIRHRSRMFHTTHTRYFVVVVVVFFICWFLTPNVIGNQRIIHWCCDSVAVVTFFCYDVHTIIHVVQMCVIVHVCMCLCVSVSGIRACKQTRLLPIFQCGKRKDNDCSCIGNEKCKWKKLRKIIMKWTRESSGNARSCRCNQTTWAHALCLHLQLLSTDSWSLMVFFLLARCITHLPACLLYLLSFLEISERI